MVEHEYKNLSGHPVWLPGPDGQVQLFNKFESKILSDWYMRYVPKHLRLVRQNARPHIILNLKPRPTIHQARVPTQSAAARKQFVPGSYVENAQAATQALQNLLVDNTISFSNDIGIGILSFNRVGSIRRCLESIYRHTDISKVTVFVSDESTDEQTIAYLKEQKKIVTLFNAHQGVAGNSNRLLCCLARFQYKFLLNDDIEVLNPDWCNVYVKALQKTGLHHFCFRQNGILKADPHQEGRVHNINGVDVWSIDSRPQGACLILDQKAFQTVGYFDEGFNPYGMEHVDWSHRVWLSGIQEAGYHDILGSNKYVRLHNEPTATPERAAMLVSARARFEQIKEDKSRIFCKSDVGSTLKGISVVVPFRGWDRSEAVISVIQNIKAQRFPIIDITLVEQDEKLSLKRMELDTVRYLLANSSPGLQFCKAEAFNKGVRSCTFKKVILHDADMLVQDDYLSKMFELLEKYDAVHIGRRVLYLDRQSTETISQIKTTAFQYRAEKVCNYFEGGSLGISADAYAQIGGFDEIYKGYGYEDLEFFSRLHLVNFLNERSLDLIHLWHTRTPGWNEFHHKNKKLWERRKPPKENAAALQGLLQQRYPRS